MLLSSGSRERDGAQGQATLKLCTETELKTNGTKSLLNQFCSSDKSLQWHSSVQVWNATVCTVSRSKLHTKSVLQFLTAVRLTQFLYWTLAACLQSCVSLNCIEFLITESVLILNHFCSPSVLYQISSDNKSILYGWYWDDSAKI